MVSLEVRCSCTVFGDQLCVVGASPELGSWDTRKALYLYTCESSFPDWTGNLPRAIIGSEFKFIKIGVHGAVTWEELPNRCWSLEKLGSVLDNTVWVTVFGDAQLRVRLKPTDDIPGSVWVDRFQTPQLGPVPDGQSPSLCGSDGGQTPQSRSRSVSEVEPLPPLIAPQVARLSRYTFKPTVSCVEVPNLRESPFETRQALWWQHEDFAQFLKLRMGLEKAYQTALRQDDMHAFLQRLEQEDQTRRGLGLGRATVRLNSTRAYVNAVLTEQERQLSLGIFDDNSLCKVAQAVSLIDLEYSMANAARDAEQSLAYQEEETEEQQQAQEQMSRRDSVTVCSGMKRCDSFGLFDPQHDPEVPDHSPTTKGFGLSCDELQQLGLRATGRRDDGLRDETASNASSPSNRGSPSTGPSPRSASPGSGYTSPKAGGSPRGGYPVSFALDGFADYQVSPGP